MTDFVIIIIIITTSQTDGRMTYDSNTALALRASRGKMQHFLPHIFSETTPHVLNDSKAALATL